VNVITRVSLLLTDAELLVMTTLGGVVSLGGGAGGGEGARGGVGAGGVSLPPLLPANTGMPMAVAAISPKPTVADNAGVALGMRPIKEPGLYKATLQSKAESLSVQTKLSLTSNISGG
jgi:hypothetical protein